MNREYVKIFSKHLGQEFEMLVYGTGGKPIMVFPSQEGRFFDYENFGMIDTIVLLLKHKKYRFIVLMVSTMKHGFRKHHIQSASPAFMTMKNNN